MFTVFNAAFMPVIYFFYPETANRSLEDIDEYYRRNPSLIVTREPDAICSKRPQKYVDKEELQVERARRYSVASAQTGNEQKDEKRSNSTHVEN